MIIPFQPRASLPPAAFELLKTGLVPGDLKKFQELEKYQSAIEMSRAGLNPIQKGPVLDLREICNPAVPVYLFGDLHAQVRVFDNLLQFKDPRYGKTIKELLERESAILVSLGDRVHSEESDKLADMTSSLVTAKRSRDLKIQHPLLYHELVGNHDFLNHYYKKSPDGKEENAVEQSRLFRLALAESLKNPKLASDYLNLFASCVGISPLVCICHGAVAFHAGPPEINSLKQLQSLKMIDSANFHLDGELNLCPESVIVNRLTNSRPQVAFYPLLPPLFGSKDVFSGQEVQDFTQKLNLEANLKSAVFAGHTRPKHGNWIEGISDIDITTDDFVVREPYMHVINASSNSHGLIRVVDGGWEALTVYDRVAHMAKLDNFKKKQRSKSDN